MRRWVFNPADRLALKNANGNYRRYRSSLTPSAPLCGNQELVLVLTASRFNCGGFYAAALQRANTQMDGGLFPRPRPPVEYVGRNDGVTALTPHDVEREASGAERCAFLSALAGRQRTTCEREELNGPNWTNSIPQTQYLGGSKQCNAQLTCMTRIPRGYPRRFC